MAAGERVLVLVHAATLDGEVELGEEGVEELKDVGGEDILRPSPLFSTVILIPVHDRVVVT